MRHCEQFLEELSLLSFLLSFWLHQCLCNIFCLSTLTALVFACNNIIHYCYKYDRYYVCVRLTFFELFEKHVERGVFEYEITRVLIELAQRFKQCVVVGIDQRQILDVQHGDNVLTAAFVNGYPRVSWIITIKIK